MSNSIHLYFFMDNSSRKFVTLKVYCILFFIISLWGNSVTAQFENKQNPSDKNNKSILIIDQKKQNSDTVVWIRDRSMNDKFSGLFNMLHGSTNTIIFNSAKKLESIEYDSIHGKYYGKLRNDHLLAPGASVFGWHPYWNKEASLYYPYSLLTTIAFFAYDVDSENGSYYDSLAIDEWKKTPLFDSAKSNKVAVLLTVTSYGKERNEKFLKNKAAWALLGNSLLSLLRLRGAQGIDIDFTEISKENSTNFVQFVRSIHEKIGDTCIITLHVKANDLKSGGINLVDLKSKAMVNTFIVQGFDYENSTIPCRAMAPLYSENSKENSIDKTLKLFEENGINAKDIVLNLPLYGTFWVKTKTSKNDFIYESTEMSFIDIVTTYEVNYSNYIAPWSRSANIVLGKNQDTIIWYESAESIRLKFEYAKRKNLQGAGLWGLGYDGGHPDIWDAVNSVYGIQSISEIRPLSINNGKLYSIMYSLQCYRKHIGIGIFIIIFFFILGLLLSFLDRRVRAIFFRRYSNVALLLSLVLMYIVIAIYCFTSDDMTFGNSILPFVIGLSVGVVIVYLISKFYFINKKKRP